MGDLQGDISKQYADIIKFISETCIDIMGKVREYAVVGMGSLARGEISLYSDFENIILLDDNISRKSKKEIRTEYSPDSRAHLFASVVALEVINEKKKQDKLNGKLVVTSLDEDEIFQYFLENIQNPPSNCLPFDILDAYELTVVWEERRNGRRKRDDFMLECEESTVLIDSIHCAIFLASNFSKRVEAALL
ncbi:unnamed protein product [Clavelina lepadiformis]|uniref:Uncharacterized protein n=1 Tax=Clavelina lepadiformis TaxID=159417 RepID=A0ABP0GWC0_CLALP